MDFGIGFVDLSLGSQFLRWACRSCLVFVYFALDLLPLGGN